MCSIIKSMGWVIAMMWLVYIMLSQYEIRCQVLQHFLQGENVNCTLESGRGLQTGNLYAIRPFHGRRAVLELLKYFSLVVILKNMPMSSFLLTFYTYFIVGIS